MFNTGNPVDSSDPRDLLDNARVLDELINGDKEFVISRLGRKLESIKGIGVLAKEEFSKQLSEQSAEFDEHLEQQNTTFQAFLLNSGYQFLGDYEDGPFKFSARNQYIRWNNQYYRLNAATDTGFTTTGVNAASFASDVTHFVLIDGDTLRQELASGNGELVGVGGGKTLTALVSAFNPLLPTPLSGNENDKGGSFDVSELSPWGQAGFTAGGKRKATMLFGRDGSIKVSVSNDRGQLTADGVMMPTVRTMFGMQSAQAIPYKLIQFPSDGFESDRKSPSMMYGCSDSGKPALFLLPPKSSLGKPADNWYDETNGCKAVTAADTYPTRRITRTGGGYYKIATIPAGSSLNNLRGQFRVIGSWNRERLAGSTELRINNFVGIDWTAAATYTAAQWSKFFKVVSDGALYDRASGAGRVSFGVTLSDNVLSVYMFLPLEFYGEISSQGTRTLTKDFVVSDELSPESAPAGLITLVRGNIFTSDNAGICSDGSIVPCDAHIRIARDADPTKTVRELTANGYLWSGSGTTNLPLSSAVSVTHTDVGVYTLNGVSGLWQSQVRLRQPYDYDGNQVAIAEISGTAPVIRVYAIKYTNDPATNVVTRTKGALMDIPANAWVDVFYSENWS